MQNILFILPELFLSISIMSLLMLGVFIKKSYKLVHLITIAVLVAAILLVLNQSSDVTKLFNDSFIVDKFSIFMKVLTFLFCLFILISSKDYLKYNDIEKIEYPILILSSMERIILSSGFSLDPVYWLRIFSF